MNKGKSTKGKANAIFTIFPYKHNGQWMFDDKERDVLREAFVAGADDLLDLICQGAEKCTAIFSAGKFPDAMFTLRLIEKDDYGSTYYCEELSHDLWLCPCLWVYINPSPETIYLKIKK